MLAQVYWLYTRGEFNKTYLLSGSLITEVDEPIRTIEKHSEAEVGHSEQVQHIGMFTTLTIQTLSIPLDEVADIDSLIRQIHENNLQNHSITKVVKILIY